MYIKFAVKALTLHKSQWKVTTNGTSKLSNSFGTKTKYTYE